MKKVIFILIFILMMSTSTLAIDSESWKNITIQDHTFKVPPKYNGGKLNENSYQIENWNNFAILCVDSYLANNYGFEASNYGPGTDLEINGHPARYFCGYNKYEKTDLSRIYFNVGESIYCVSYQGSNLTEDIEEIVATSDISQIPSSEFYNTLDSAENNYSADEEAEKNTYVPYYNQPSHHHHHFRPYYF